MSLQPQMGWCAFEQHLKDSMDDLESLNQVAKVTAVHRSHMEAINRYGKQLQLQLGGKFSHFADFAEELPAVGDWCVHSDIFNNERGSESALVLEVLPRKSQLTRVSPSGSLQVLAANVDTAFLVTSANKDLNENRLHRYLVLCREGKVKPVIVLSKSDLNSEATTIVESLREKYAEIDIVCTSIMDSLGIEDLRALLKPEESFVFLGSSGVGKSSLVNALMGETAQVTQDIRADDDKGKHTTTARQMFISPSGALIIDTPGLREIQVIGDASALDADHDQIAELILQCKFRDCTHSGEAGCAIQAALESGDLDASEYQSWQKLQRELAYNARKLDKRESSNSKKKWKQINKNYRAKKKAFGR